MVVNQPLPADHQCFKEIMVCIDFSASCRYALQLAVLLAEVHHSRLHIFHMLPLPTATRCPQDELERQIGDLTEQLKRFCRESSLELDAKFTVWEGTNPHQEILKYARDKGIDLIAMGSHTKEKANKWYVGSAVEQVSSRALCPVAIVTDPKSVLKLIK
jgi:nucleotide-binding universal stress UspA family protein